MGGWSYALLHTQRVTRLVLITVLFGFAGAALWAHAGVTNPVVMARLENMITMGQAMKTLSQMVKGHKALDPEKAVRAAQQIA